MPSLVPSAAETGSALPPPRAPRFRDLRVRAKLMVLHNVFFLVLTAGVYYSVIPLVEQHVVAQRSGGAASAERASGVVREARLRLFAALGLIYVLAVLVLELLIMPRYVYRPIQATLDADESVQEGDRDHELIQARAIPGDEIGDIMRSRNATVRKLREKEAGLELALARLGELAQDLRRKNEQLETARRGMAAQDRLATIGLLSASVAHEINTPLSVLRGSIEQLLETASDPQTRERLTRIRRVADRLNRISESLLDFSSTRRPPHTAPVNLRAVVDEAWGLLALDERAAAVAFHNEIPRQCEAPGDEDRLMQVFVNLLKNGVYAMDSAGDIVVRARQDHTDVGDWVIIEVDDDGPASRPTLRTLRGVRLIAAGFPRHGSGLTVAEGIVEQHGASLPPPTVPRRRPPDRSPAVDRVRFACDLRSQGSHRMSASNEPTQSPDAMVNVAVLDDDPDFLSYIEDFLRAEGLYTVRTFTHPEDLYQAAEQRRPDIVLLDMKMGPFSGATVLTEIQERWPEVCLIVVTGYPSLEEMRATFKRKAFDYLAKPFSLAQMRQTLSNAVESYGLGRSPAVRLREQLGRRIKMLRVEHGWSLKDLAKQSGISVSQLSSIERGAHMPSMESLLALARALSTRPSDLLKAIDF